MQVEQPHHPPSNLRDFLRQYAMIVLSILTALTLEQAAVALHNASAAAASRARIEAEIDTTRTELKLSRKRNLDRLNAIKEQERALLKELNAPQPNQAAVVSIAAKVLPLVDVEIPDYPTNAWETAVADQSASHLSSSDLHRYADIYTAERNAINLPNMLLQGDILARFSNANLDLIRGKSDAVALSQLIVHYLLITRILDHQQADLLARIGDPKP
jgi:hypothetical protein